MLRKPSRSRLAEHIMSHLRSWGILVKTLHIPNENWKFFDNNDFYPFLRYSLNKKRRWEVDFLEDLTEIQDFYGEDVEVLFLKRSRTEAYDWPHYYETTLPGQFRIRAVHQLSHKQIYKKQEVNSIFGQDFKNFDASKNMENKGVVAYNFIGSQENYLKIFKKKLIRKRDNEWPHTTGWQRVKRREVIDMEIRNLHNDLTENSDTESLELEDEPESVSDQRFYNLEEHIKEKRVKRRC
ncbi:hypothetical protein GCK72_021704 [Caenorhabditis remanei]|uniref:Uncharacterized protein n=1 Tax=Caenorhabditis remanei TaxID=31234 RepID=A0A6A5GKS8_CAERE|nr:hypothetical protein GCK72_021704 [Caenorhabditis remanei]KAF1755135.1 hypothetical protein GCK72_021704 [Caenorhabditis remanei]